MSSAFQKQQEMIKQLQKKVQQQMKEKQKAQVSLSFHNNLQMGLQQNISKSRSSSALPGDNQDGKVKQLPLHQTLHIHDLSRKAVQPEVSKTKADAEKKKFNMNEFTYQPKDDLTLELASIAKERETQIEAKKALAKISNASLNPKSTFQPSQAMLQVKETLSLVEKKLLSAQNKLSRASIGQQKAEVKSFDETMAEVQDNQEEQVQLKRLVKHNSDHIINTVDHSDIKHTQKVLFDSTASQTAAKGGKQMTDTTPVEKTSQFSLSILGQSSKQKTPTEFKHKKNSDDDEDYEEGPQTDDLGNRLSILPNKNRPKVPSTKKKSSMKSAVTKKQSVKGVKEEKVSIRKRVSKAKQIVEEEEQPKNLAEQVQRDISKLKSSKTINKTGQQRTNFVKMNLKAYKPRMRGAQFNNKMMAKKTNALRFNERFKKKLQIEQAKNRDQVNAYGGLGKVGLNYEGKEKEEGEEDLVPGFSASALRFVKKIAETESQESRDDDNLLDDDIEEIKQALEKIDEDVKEEESSQEVHDGDFDKAIYKIPENDEGYVKILKQRFGHESFKIGQLEAIKLLLEKKENTLVVLATGGGKSLVYQYVSLFLTGLVIVVTPLISLMTDQLQKLPDFIPGAAINSQQQYTLKRQVIQAIQDKHIKVLFVSPEKLFIEDLSRYNRRIAMVCVDEIHCSSEWSHNFRPAYLKLNDMIKEKVAHANKVFLNNLRNTSSKTKGLKDLDENCVILGLTATATKATQSSICKNFEIKHPDNIITEPNLARLNLSLSITRDPEKLKGLLTLLQSPSFKKLTSILIFATHRGTCERLASHLNVIIAYLKFLSKMVSTVLLIMPIRVLVCTIAFSMGIDKSDIQSVVHYDMPKSIENYVQEIGRAGRDGKLARCHLFLNNVDFYQIRRLILTDLLDQQNAIRITNKIIVEAKRKVLQIIKRLPQPPRQKKRKANQISGEQQNEEPEEESERLIEKFEFESEISHLYKKDDNQKIDLSDIPDIKNAHDPKVYVFLDVKQTCKQLDLKKEVILTMLNCLEKLPNSFFKLEGILPEKIGIRFHAQSPEHLAGKNEFIAKYLEHAKSHGGVWGASISNLAYELGMNPFHIPRVLFNLQNNGEGDISYETDDDAFVLRLLHVPNGGQTVSISQDMLNETRRIEKNMIQKLNCMYFVAKKVSLPTVEYMLKKEKSDDKDGGEEMYTNFSKQLNGLINMYFTISKEENMEIQIAGSEEERNIMMPLVYINSHREKANVEGEIKAILRDYHEGEKSYSDHNDRIKALDIVKILIGIMSERVTVKRYMNETKYWAIFQDYDYEDLFKVATNVVSNFYIDMVSGGTAQAKNDEAGSLNPTKKRKLNSE